MVKSLRQTSTAKQNTAPSLVRIKSVHPIGKQAVYNMEVEVHHNFSVNGGLVVHNCIDATRYACEPLTRKKSFSFD